MVNSRAVLVTGSKGYIGSVLVPTLLEQGCDVSGADVGWFLDEPLNGDFSKLQTEDLKLFNTVIHLAGFSDDKLCKTFSEQAKKINVIETLAFSQKCKQAGVKRFVFASSASVYGNISKIATENHPVSPGTLYSQNKAAVEKFLIQLADTGFHVVCLRFGSCYGMSPELRQDLVLNRLAIRAIVEGKIGLMTDGQCYRPFVHVNDIAAAIVHVVLNPIGTNNHCIFNISHPQGNMRVNQAVELLAKVTGTTLLDSGDKKDLRSYRVNPTRFIESGFTYQWPLEKGIELMVRQLCYQGNIRPEQDRIQKLKSVFQLRNQDIVTQPGNIGSVSPSKLAITEQKAYLDSVGDIIANSRYRLADADSHSCTAAELLGTQYQINSDQQVLMWRSGTDALIRALQVLQIKAGSHVAMPDQCFHAVAASVSSIGAIPVWVDTRADDFNLDPQALAAKLQDTKVDCVIAVDNYGTPANWKSIATEARRHNIPLIVDACESLGASRQDQRVVDHADIIVVSFSFTKPIHAAGMGGAMIANKAIIQQIETQEKYLYRQFRLPEINAAYLVRAWANLDNNIEHLRDIYRQYTEVAESFGFTPQKEYGISTRIHAPFLVPSDWAEEDRDSLIVELNKKGIRSDKLFPCQSALLSLESRCKVSLDTSARVITLPTGGSLDQIILEKILHLFNQTVRHHRKRRRIGGRGAPALSVIQR